MTTFRQLLESFEQSAKTQAAKGRRFEDFCEAFLKIDPIWSERFEAVWSWQDWPDRTMGHPDMGIDLIARERGTNDLVAIQCKFYSPSATLSWSNVATFFGASNGNVAFRSGLLITTAGSESSNFHKNIATSAKDIVIWRVDDFEESLVDWNQFRPETPTQLSLADRKTLRPHQVEAVDAVVEGSEHSDRGQLIMACGTGKTFYVPSSCRATGRAWRFGPFLGAFHQLACADGGRVGHRRGGAAVDVRCVFRPARWEASRRRRGHVAERSPGPGVDGCRRPA